MLAAGDSPQTQPQAARKTTPVSLRERLASSHSGTTEHQLGNGSTATPRTAFNVEPLNHTQPPSDDSKQFINRIHCRPLHAPRLSGPRTPRATTQTINRHPLPVTPNIWPTAIVNVASVASGTAHGPRHRTTNHGSPHPTRTDHSCAFRPSAISKSFIAGTIIDTAANP